MAKDKKKKCDKKKCKKKDVKKGKKEKKVRTSKHVWRIQGCSFQNSSIPVIDSLS